MELALGLLIREDEMEEEGNLYEQVDWDLGDGWSDVVTEEEISEEEGEEEIDV